MHIKDFTDTTNLVIELRYQDLRDAERDGLLTKTQADTLWRRWSRDAMTTHSTQPLERTAAPAAGPAFGFVNVLYYFGGLVAIGAMSLFMTLPPRA